MKAVATTLFLSLAALDEAGPPPIPAFPGAEGAGKWTSGGRGGRVITVAGQTAHEKPGLVCCPAAVAVSPVRPQKMQAFNMTRSFGLLTVTAIFLSPLTGSAQVASVAPQPLVEQTVAAVGGRDKLLKIFRFKEIFHFGDKPEPPAGKQRSQRESVYSQPDQWWIGQKERGDEPAKEDVRAWSLDLLIDPKSQFEILPGLTDEGKLLAGLRVTGSVTPAMDFYFDPETSLLYRLDWRGDFYRFSDWKEHDGLKYASRTVILKKKDGKPWFFHEITELERLDQLPQGLVKP